MALEYIGKFIGPNEIHSISLAEYKTPAGNDIFEVVFKDGKKRIYTKETFEYICTDTISDYSSVTEKKLLPVIRKTMAVLAEHDINAGEVDMFLKQLMTNIDNSFNRATNYMWFQNDKEFTPNFDPTYDVSLLMAHKVITDIPVDEPKDS